MKILWLAHRDIFNPKSGGAERTIYEVTRRLSKMGFEVTVVSASWAKSKNREQIDEVKLLRLGSSIVVHLCVPFIILFGKYDVVVNDLAHIVPWVSSSIFKKKTIVFFRHLHSRSLPGQVNKMSGWILASLEKCYCIFYRTASFVTESDTSINDLIGLSIPRERIYKIPPGVDWQLFKLGKKTNYPSIVYFGGLREYKRPEESLRVLSNISDKISGIHLFIIGDGPKLPHLKKLAKELKLEDMVTFTGRILDSRLASLVSSAWLNIHASVTEGWGLSVVEASACGTPTVAYDVPGINEVIKDGINGYKIRDGDVKQFIDAVERVILAPERLWQSSVLAVTKFTWEISVELWRKLLV